RDTLDDDGASTEELRVAVVGRQPDRDDLPGSHLYARVERDDLGQVGVVRIVGGYWRVLGLSAADVDRGRPAAIGIVGSFDGLARARLETERDAEDEELRRTTRHGHGAL